jgi:predicted metal-dependent phosphoesterase TrpH
MTDIAPLQIDLHSHSTASDGELTPSQLVQRASERGVHTLALTDHDTTDGIAEARAAAGALRLIPGIEISVSWHSHVIHIVGLTIDPDNPNLQQGLVQLNAQRQQRACKIARELEKLGLKNAYEGAKKFAGGQLIGRTHFAHLLVEQGLAKDIRGVFKRYLIRGKPGYVAAQWAHLEDALNWIKSAGGIAVVAHPARYKLTRTKLKQLLSEFKELGGIALEVVSGSHSRSDVISMAQLARQFEFYSSAGSDYHGPQHVWIELGRLPALPDGCEPVWALFKENTRSSP